MIDRAYIQKKLINVIHELIASLMEYENCVDVDIFEPVWTIDVSRIMF